MGATAEPLGKGYGIQGNAIAFHVDDAQDAAIAAMHDETVGLPHEYG